MSTLQVSILRYYSDGVQFVAETIIEAWQVLEKRFDSPHYRAEAQNYLTSYEQQRTDPVPGLSK